MYPCLHHKYLQSMLNNPTLDKLLITTNHIDIINPFIEMNHQFKHLIKLNQNLIYILFQILMPIILLTLNLVLFTILHTGKNQLLSIILESDLLQVIRYMLLLYINNNLLFQNLKEIYHLK